MTSWKILFLTKNFFILNLKSVHMKQFFQISLFAFLLAVVFTSCLKDLKGDCEFKSKYIYEPIVFDETCNCIVAGKVKYLNECQTVVLLDYGNGTCDNKAIKTICKDGKCELSAGAHTEEVEVDCKESIVEGPISAAEALELGI